MSFEDRERKIIQLVKEKNYISVKELTKLLYVSEPTIRRDLTLLEKKGLLKRNRGGASYVSRQQTQYPQAFRHDENIQEKKYIARLASQFVQNGDSVFMDASSSCFYLAQYINRDKKLNVMTHGFAAAKELAKSSNINVEVVCGKYDIFNDAVYGADACNYVRSRYADICFMSMGGLDVSQGLTNLYLEDAEITRVYHQQAKKTILLADHTKINCKYYIKVFDLAEIDVLITDRPLPEEFDSFCFDHDIDVIFE